MTAPPATTTKMAAVKKGDKIPTWFSDREDGLSTVLGVLPYTGKYSQWFNCVLVLTAPRTRARQIEMAYNSKDNEHHA